MKNLLRQIYLWIKCGFIGYLFRKLSLQSSQRVHLVIEDADWATAYLSGNLLKAVNDNWPDYVCNTLSPERYENSIIHFHSQYMWLMYEPYLSKSNKYIATYFHGKHEDGADVAHHINLFLSKVKKLSYVVTAATLIENRLLSWGVPREKLIKIPIGVDTDLFRPVRLDFRRRARSKFNISNDALVVGSFQKDGVGWGNGDIPKLIKGPDILVEALIELNKKTKNLHVLLTGPARGYVISRLKLAGISYTHSYFQSQSDLLDCYHALDCYWVTSREEGGPMGMLESMSCGVPVVSSKVGMAPDVIRDGVSGYLIEVGDIRAYADVTMNIKKNADALGMEARNTMNHYSWNSIGKLYHTLYESLR